MAHILTQANFRQILTFVRTSPASTLSDPPHLPRTCFSPLIAPSKVSSSHSRATVQDGSWLAHHHVVLQYSVRSCLHAHHSLSTDVWSRHCVRLSLESAAERVFSLLKSMFGDMQMSALADMIQAALMLKYNGRKVS